MVAVRGRAARLGERALGHVDPGAASAVVILKAMALTFCDASKGRTAGERAGRSVRKPETHSERRKGSNG
jgi:hypothetical protein